MKREDERIAKKVYVRGVCGNSFRESTAKEVD